MAELLGVIVRTVKNWEKEGVPEFGLATTNNVVKLLMSRTYPDKEATQ